MHSGTFSDLEIKQAHALSQLEIQHARLNELVAEQVAMLLDARHALQHDQLEVCDEFLERVAIKLRRAVQHPGQL